MADSNTNGIEKGPAASGDAPAPAPELQPSDPPAAKGPMNAAEESIEPAIATKTATDSAATAPSSDAAAQNDAPATNSKEELTEKIDAAEKLAEQPEEPADSAPAPAPNTTRETAIADAPSLTNGEAKEPPKPVSVEEVRDQDLPPVAPSQPVEMTGALPVQEPAKDAPKAAPTPLTPEPEKTEAVTGEKRKPSDAEAPNGDVPVEKPSEDAPAEKKQKTNGATTNGAPKKAGRPKKNKKAPPAVGRTARKTRSQGAAD
ncbi:hypothetical protein F5Y06DRAFT_214863 [Hypoxylon sp. FL0890]|nr:hypothetical protein F5Y06DRAFT_214863 [Hypoxylon sp. FL0890]